MQQHNFLDSNFPLVLLVGCIVAVAVLGIALIAMGEDIGSEMAFRSFGHLVCIKL